MRKLASIQKIKKIKQHNNADKLELATILGWQVIVPKEQFKENDLVVYFEIDSLLPDEKRYEFLKKTSWNGRYNKIRLKSIKLRGEISQGLILPLNNFPEINFSTLNEGDDLTKILGIEKYEPIIPASLGGDVNKFTWPISKTDEERCIHEDGIVLTPSGPFKIKEICEREDINKVYSYNILNDTLEIKEIQNKTITKNKKAWKKIFFEDGTFIITTDDHKIFLPELGVYREAVFLKQGNIVLSI